MHKPTRRPSPAAIALAAAILLLASCADETLPIPTGPHPVGAASMGIGSGVEETLAMAWYPADARAEGRRLPQNSPNQVKALSVSLGFPEAFLSQAPSNCIVDAPVARPPEGGWPLLFFFHGLGSFPMQNLTQMEELASQGHVVVSLGFPGESAVCEFPDGRVAWQDDTGDLATLKAQNSDAGQVATRLSSLYRAVKDARDTDAKFAALRALTADPYFAIAGRVLERRIAPAIGAIEAIAYGNAWPLFAGKLDGSRIGAYGHSLGGSLAMAIALRRPELVKAVANMDAPVFEAARSDLAPLEVPSLFMYATDQKIGGATLPSDGVNDAYFETSAAPSWSVAYRGAGHYNFSDAGYVWFLKFTGLNGPVDGAACARLVQSHLSAFFGAFLGTGKPMPDFTAPGAEPRSRR
jgi:pimeloyl-ACP methyl ester carboxylesterase